MKSISPRLKQGKHLISLSVALRETGGNQLRILDEQPLKINKNPIKQQKMWEILRNNMIFTELMGNMPYIIHRHYLLKKK